MTINMGTLDVRFRPLDGSWPGEPTPDSARERSPFRRGSYRADDGSYRSGGPTPWSTTLDDLRRELDAIRATDVVVRMELPEGRIRNDGLPYANATPDHPGVVLSFELRDVGRVQYACDTYRDWRANVRAIAKTLENLRACERWGVLNRSEQYRGSLALPPGEDEPFRTIEDALGFVAGVGKVKLRSSNGVLGQEETIAVLARRVRDNGPDDALVASAIRRAQKRAHPDSGGAPETFRRLRRAIETVREVRPTVRIEG